MIINSCSRKRRTAVAKSLVTDDKAAHNKLGSYSDEIFFGTDGGVRLHCILPFRGSQIMSFRIHDLMDN